MKLKFMLVTLALGLLCITAKAQTFSIDNPYHALMGQITVPASGTITLRIGAEVHRNWYTWLNYPNELRGSVYIQGTAHQVNFNGYVNSETGSMSVYTGTSLANMTSTSSGTSRSITGDWVVNIAPGTYNLYGTTLTIMGTDPTGATGLSAVLATGGFQVAPNNHAPTISLSCPSVVTNGTNPNISITVSDQENSSGAADGKLQTGWIQIFTDQACTAYTGQGWSWKAGASEPYPLINNGTHTTTSAVTGLVPGQTYYVKGLVRDTMGATAQAWVTTSSAFKVADSNTLPTISITNSPTTLNVGSVNPNITISVYDNDNAGGTGKKMVMTWIQIFRDSSYSTASYVTGWNWANPTNTTYTSTSPVNFTAGTYYIKASVRDSTDAPWVTATRSFTVTAPVVNTLPTVSITSCPGTLTAGDVNPNITISVYDKDNVSGAIGGKKMVMAWIQVFRDASYSASSLVGTGWNWVTPSNTTYTSTSTLTLTAGTYYVLGSVRDDASGAWITDNCSFTVVAPVVNTLPTIDITACPTTLTPGTVNPNITINVYDKDNVSGATGGKKMIMAWIQVFRDASYSASSLVGSGWNWVNPSNTTYSSTSAIALTAGTYYVLGSVRDDASGAWVTDNCSFTVAPRYTLTVRDGYTNTTIDTRSNLASGAVSTIVAPPHAGQYFAGWVLTSGNGTFTNASSSTTTFTIYADSVVTATYLPIATPKYTLTVRDGFTGMVVGTYTNLESGTVTPISAANHSGAAFTSWTLTSGSGAFGNALNASTTFTITSNSEVRSNYASNTYTLTVKNGLTGGTIGVYNNLASGSSTNISTSSQTGYNFDGWTLTTGNGTFGNASSMSTSFTIYANSTVTANYSPIAGPPKYTLTVKDGYNGNTLNTYTGLDSGAVTSITTVTHTGYNFSGWALTSGTGSFGNASNFTTTFTLTSNAVVTANYTVIPVTYTLTVKDGFNGSTLNTITNLASGASAPITTGTHSGYNFTGWTLTSGSGTFTNSSNANTNFTITANSTVTANYAVATTTYNITVMDGFNGSTLATHTNQADGAVIAIVCGTHAGYDFTGWTVSGAGSFANAANSSTNFTVRSNATITANFAPSAKYVLTVIDGVTGTGNTYSNLSYNASVAITAAPHIGYTFTGWTINTGTGTLASTSNPSTTYTIQTDSTVYANYSSQAASGTITLLPAIQFIPAGSSANLTWTTTGNPSAVKWKGTAPSGAQPILPTDTSPNGSATLGTYNTTGVYTVTVESVP